ncbi:hypothetical protein SK128_021356 [Halocaridina rubra]|uniref:Uncharacterized protein n=1 Tax=Halocaridina rubra TaxID=373956 RepID=A0AAN8WFF2_HALRR
MATAMSDPDLTCIICQEDFSDSLHPRSLACGHSLCTECLDNYFLKDRDKVCPECRQPFYGKSSADLPVNFSLLRLARSTTTTKCIKKQSCEQEFSQRKLDPQPKIAKGSKIVIEDMGFGPVWKAGSCEFSCEISSPSMQSEFLGMKNYISYSVLPSFSTKHVSRRYKQFDWLHKQLKTIYPLIVLPPLPEKHILGNLEESVVNHRTYMLQVWLNRICRHPVLSHCEMFQLFITVSNEKLWRAGSIKVTSETEAYKTFCTKVEIPNFVLDLEQIEAKVEGYAYAINELEKALNELQSAALNQADNYMSNISKENIDIGRSFEKLAHAFGIEPTSDDPKLPLTIYLVGEAFLKMSELPMVDLENEWRSLNSLLSEYYSLVGGLHKILQLIRKEISKARQPESDNFEEVKVAAYVFQAEVAHYYQVLAKDIKVFFKSILNKQYAFYQMILKHLKETFNAIMQQDTEEPSAPPLELVE